MISNVGVISKRILASKHMGLRKDVEREWLEREQRIARYCADRMDADEAAAFEAELLSDSGLASDVQAAMLLRDALDPPGAAARPAVATPGFARSPWLALAAGVLIGAVGLSIVRDADRPAAVINEVEYLTLGVVRSAEPPATPRVQRVSEQSLLIVEVPAEPSIAKVEVIRPDGQSQVVTGTRDAGYLRIALAPPVKSGAYAIVSGDGRFSFSVESRSQ